MVLTGAVRKVAAGFSWVFNPRREPLVQVTYALSYVPISVFGVLGMVLTRRDWRMHSLIYLQFLAFIAVSAIFWAHTSHRAYLDVYLIVFAVFAAERLYETICRKPAKRVGKPNLIGDSGGVGTAGIISPLGRHARQS